MIERCLYYLRHSGTYRNEISILYQQDCTSVKSSEFIGLPMLIGEVQDGKSKLKVKVRTGYKFMSLFKKISE